MEEPWSDPDLNGSQGARDARIRHNSAECTLHAGCPALKRAMSSGGASGIGMRRRWTRGADPWCGGGGRGLRGWSMPRCSPTLLLPCRHCHDPAAPASLPQVASWKASEAPPPQPMPRSSFVARGAYRWPGRARPVEEPSPEPEPPAASAAHHTTLRLLRTTLPSSEAQHSQSSACPSASEAWDHHQHCQVDEAEASANEQTPAEASTNEQKPAEASTNEAEASTNVAQPRTEAPRSPLPPLGRHPSKSHSRPWS